MRRGQSTLDYIFTLGILIAALITMGVYMKRGFQGKYRELGEQVGAQYSPLNTASTLNNTTTSDTTSTSTTTATKVYNSSGVSTLTTEQENLNTPVTTSHTESTDTTAGLEGKD